jgi:hypothetical protein
VYEDKDDTKDAVDTGTSLDVYDCKYDVSDKDE